MILKNPYIFILYGTSQWECKMPRKDFKEVCIFSRHFDIVKYKFVSVKATVQFNVVYHNRNNSFWVIRLR